jgi:hypothetical protein
MKLRWALAALLLGALHASAQDLPSAVPEGFVKIETEGKFVLHARTAKAIGPVAKAALSKNLKDLFKDVGADMNIGAASLSCAPGSDLPALDRARLDVVVFANDAERDDVAMKLGFKPDFGSGDKYIGCVYLTLTDGVVERENLVQVYRFVTAQLNWHAYYFGAPQWLDRGIAEYEAWSCKPAGKPGDLKDYAAMIQRLTDQKSQRTGTPISDLLLKDASKWTQADTDASWVLTHLLLSELRSTYEDLASLLTLLQRATFSRGEGARVDSRRALKIQLERALGGAAGLQFAWEFHRDGLLKSSTTVPKLKRPPTSISDAAGFMKFDCTADAVTTDPVPGKAPTSNVSLTGRWAYAPIGPGAVNVTAALADKKETWSKELNVVAGRSDTQATPVSWNQVTHPLGATSRKVRVTVTWDVDGGAVYKVSTVQDIEFRGKK